MSHLYCCDYVSRKCKTMSDSNGLKKTSVLRANTVENLRLPSALEKKATAYKPKNHIRYLIFIYLFLICMHFLFLLLVLLLFCWIAFIQQYFFFYLFIYVFIFFRFDVIFHFFLFYSTWFEFPFFQCTCVYTFLFFMTFLFILCVHTECHFNVRLVLNALLFATHIKKRIKQHK